MTRLLEILRYSRFLVCSGCTIGPKYQRPAAPVAPAFKELNGNDQWKMATPSDQLLKGKWWEIFNDPELNRLEELVNVNNQNVKQAEAQFRQARALVDLNHANYYPTIGSTPSITQTDSGRNGRRWGWQTSQSFSLPATVSWEPDLWGRVRLAVENAADNAQVSAADLENIRLSTQASAGDGLFHAWWATICSRAILTDTIVAYQRNLQLTINRFNGGVASRSDITLAQTQLAGAQAQSTDLRIARAQLEHAIAVLTGASAVQPRGSGNEDRGPPPPIPLALPSPLLERRPDIAANERLMAAANANIGIAADRLLSNFDAFSHARIVEHQPGKFVHLGQPGLVSRPIDLPDLVRFRAPQRPGSGRPSRLRCHRRRLSPDRARRPSRKWRMIWHRCAI